MNKTHYETGEETGRRAMLRELVEARFSTLSVAVEERLNQMSLQERIDLGKTLIRAQSLADLGLEK